MTPLVAISDLQVRFTGERVVHALAQGQVLRQLGRPHD